MTVKIENTPQALPQWGIDQADVVYEEIVNGGITRLAAIFNSHAPAKVGPVRSVRPTDTQVVWPLGGIFAYSGGAPYAVASISTAPVKLIDESSAGTAMFRDPNLYAPHNLFAVAPAALRLRGYPGAAAAALLVPARDPEGGRPGGRELRRALPEHVPGDLDLGHGDDVVGPDALRHGRRDRDRAFASHPRT